MKIIHYIPSLDEHSGGVGAYLQLLARDLGKLCELHVLTHKSNNERVLENCKVHYMSNKWLPWDNCKKEFLKILNEIKPDVFHTNSCWTPLSALTAMWASEYRVESLEKKSMKIIYTPHGMLEPYALQRHYWTKKFPAILMFQKKGLKICDMIHATADSEKENLLKLGWNKNVVVVSNCVQIDQIQSKFDSEIQVSQGFMRSKTILFLSRVHPKKGVNFLIEAIAKIRDESPELIEGYTINVVGPGEEAYIDKLVNLCNMNNLHVESYQNNTLNSKISTLTSKEPVVRFLGPIFRDAKWPLYREADLFVLPTYSENFGIVIAEALASGTPVITTYGTPWAELNGNQKFSSETIDDGLNSSETGETCETAICNDRCGWCIEVGTQPLVEALRSFLMCSTIEIDNMGKRGRKLVENKYTSEAVARQFVSMYESLLYK